MEGGRRRERGSRRVGRPSSAFIHVGDHKLSCDLRRQVLTYALHSFSCPPLSPWPPKRGITFFSEILHTRTEHLWYNLQSHFQRKSHSSATYKFSESHIYPLNTGPERTVCIKAAFINCSRHLFLSHKSQWGCSNVHTGCLSRAM